MRIDIPTLSTIVPLVYSINILISVTLFAAGRTFRGASYWIIGQVCMGLAFFGICLRPYLPPFLGSTAVYVLFLSSPVFYANSLWNFRFERRFPKICYLVIPILIPTFFLLQNSSFNLKAIVFSSFMGAGSLFNAAILLYKVEPEYRVPNYITAIPYILIGIVNIIRVPLNIVSAPIQDYNEQSGFNAIYFMFALGVASITLFGYFMMTMIHVERDIRGKKAEIERGNRELRELNRSKDTYISVIAHDLRGPIGGAARYARKHILNSQDDFETKWKAIGTLTSTLERINSFLEKLLLLSRAQQEAWKPVPESIDLPAAIKEAASLIQAEAEAKAIRLELPKPAEDLRIYANLESVSLILSNLISNAVKFSPMGGRVSVSASGKGDGILTTVEDCGTGIERKMLPLIFQFESKQTRRGTEGEEGSGLGLMLCKALIKKNLGDMEIESAPGKGTKVSFWMPKPPR